RAVVDAARQRRPSCFEPQLQDGLHVWTAHREPGHLDVAELPHAGRPDWRKWELAMRARTIRRWLGAAAIATGVALRASSAAANVPTSVTHQGRLYNAAGQPVTGTLQVAFAIYDAPTVATPIWTETHSLTFDDGY